MYGSGTRSSVPALSSGANGGRTHRLLVERERKRAAGAARRDQGAADNRGAEGPAGRGPAAVKRGAVGAGGQRDEQGPVRHRSRHRERDRQRLRQQRRQIGDRVADGVVGLALGTGRTGALELLDGRTGKVTKIIPLGAPARAVVVGSNGVTFYVLNGTAKSASVTMVNSQSGAVQGTVPVPLETVSIAPDARARACTPCSPAA